MKICWLFPSLVSLFLLAYPTKAANLASCKFNPDLNQLDLTTDARVQPQVMLLTNPSRLVIDLPGVTLGSPEIDQTVGSVIQEIRIGQLNPQTTRMVVELAPGYTLDLNQVRLQQQSPTHWLVQLPTPQRLTNDYLFLRRSANSLDTATEIESPNLSASTTPQSLFAGAIALATPMTLPQQQIVTLMHQYKSLQSGMFFLDLETGNYLDINGDRIFSAASTIKLPILVALFQAIDAGRVRLNDTLVMRRDLITNGSGTMQYQRAGKRFSVLETVTKMITISDNTATNMIIDRLGGIVRLNQQFRSWGLQQTVIHHLLADLRGTNTTSSKDLVRLLAMLASHQLVSDNSQQQIFALLRRTTVKTLLRAGLGQGAIIANKTGDIGFLIGDAGLITMPSGQRYLAGIFVRRPYDDPRGRDFIRQVSQLMYDYLNQPPLTSSLGTEH